MTRLLLSNDVNSANPSGNHTEGQLGFASRFTFQPHTGRVITTPTPPPLTRRLGFPVGFNIGISFRTTNGPSLFLPAVTDPTPQDYFAFAMVLKGDLPEHDPTNFYQYAFVFDADGDTSNNYTPLPQYPADFFKDTDRWYELLYTPTGGWTTKVSTAHGQTIAPAQSDAHLYVVGSVIFLLVPTSELASETPGYRFTAFRHKGDYGLQPPHDFDGFVDPPVSLGLYPFTP